MKKITPLLLIALALTQPGCAWTKRHVPWHHSTKTAKVAKPADSTIVTPDESVAAKVVRVNAIGRFAVLNFPEGKLPKVDQHLFLYHDGLKEAEVKVVGPRQENSIVADIVSGEAHAGDTVRDQ